VTDGSTGREDEGLPGRRDDDGLHDVNGTPTRRASMMMTKLQMQAATQIPTYCQEWKKPPPKKKIDVTE
jgi:hypothetical protein